MAIIFRKWHLVGILVLASMIFLAANSFFIKNENAIAKELISKIKATKETSKQAKLYRELIEKIGPEKAQDELFNSGLPFTGQTHLINHTVGDYLYEKYGAGGLVYCKDYFLSSCYHGFILHAIGRGGPAEVSNIFNECLKFGPDVYTQCSHAIGHGFLPYVGYGNLLEAIKMCDQMERDIPKFPVYNCHDGVFMENVWGVHEGKPSPDRWVKESDPTYPCSDPRIDKKYHLACWSNQSSLMFQFFRGDIKKVGQECHKLSDPGFKRNCFNALARQIHPISDGKTERVFEMCKLMPGEWVDYCITTNAVAYLGVGDTELPFDICEEMQDPGKGECYKALIGPMKFLNVDLCDKISDETWRNKCKQN